ncbi:hypothetical protein KLAE6086_24170 [Klebsiella aerogenes]
MNINPVEYILYGLVRQGNKLNNWGIWQILSYPDI